MKIGIYGGSFNPVHRGHTSVAKYAIKKLKLDKLYFVLAFKAPFKSKIKYVDAQHRANMLNIVKPKKSEVSMFEINKKGVSFTINTIRHFKLKFPNDELFLLIGSDNVYKLNKWKAINEIVEKAKIIVLQRQGGFSQVNIKRYGAILLNNPLFDYASSWFRKGYMHNIDDNVMKYISSNYLYIIDFLTSASNARAKHCVSTGSYAAKFAKSASVNPQKAWVAGCLHDITKVLGWTKEQHRQYLQNKGVDATQVKDYELHSLTGMIWVRDEYKLNDSEILNAIGSHTTLTKKLSNLDKVVYAADKMCEGRTHKGIQEDRKLIVENFDAGFTKIVNVVYKILLETKRPLSQEQIKIFKELM